MDAVFAAEAFHLFASERVVGQIARVLRPSGVLVLMWNLPAGPTKPSIAAAERLLKDRGPDRDEAGYDPADLNPSRYASGEWRRPFVGSRFGEFREARLPNPQTVGPEPLVAFLASMGWIADLPDATRLPPGGRAAVAAARGRIPPAVGDACPLGTAHCRPTRTAAVTKAFLDQAVA